MALHTLKTLRRQLRASPQRKKPAHALRKKGKRTKSDFRKRPRSDSDFRKLRKRRKESVR